MEVGNLARENPGADGVLVQAEEAEETQEKTVGLASKRMISSTWKSITQVLFSSQKVMFMQAFASTTHCLVFMPSVYMSKYCDILLLSV